MGYDVTDERTQLQPMSPTWDRPAEDLTFLALRGPDVGTRFLVKPPGGVIGREDGAAVKCRDPTISRRAALIEFRADNKVLITDLGSKNGVWVNGVRISRAEIYDGNHVQLSNDTVLRVRFQDPAETELLEQMQVAVVRDQLTRLPNRRYVAERLPQEMSYARRRGEPLSVGLVDIDDYKKVVDADGQAAADKLLVLVAEQVQSQTRCEDVLARYGATELLLILRGTTADEAGELANRVSKAIGAQVFDVGGDVSLRGSVSIGLATFMPATLGEDEQPSEPLSADEALELAVHADAALFRAKDGGDERIAHWEG